MARDDFGMRLRSFLRQVHLWMGLSLGLLFVVLGLSGAALVFYIEIDAALHSELHSESGLAAPGWQSPVWDQALTTARSYRSNPRSTWTFEVNGETGPIAARYYPPSGLNGHHAEREMIWFSPDGSQVIRSDMWGDYLMSWLYELHMHLLAGETGRQIVGWSGFAILALIISGLILWWPRGSWRKALAFKRQAAPVRRLYDIHKLSGLWSLLLLALLVITGTLLALPEVKTTLFSTVISTPDTIPSPRSSASSGQQIPVAAALASAHQELPDSNLAFIDVPGIGDEPFRIRVQVPGDPHRRFPNSFVFVDQYSAQVLAVHDLRESNAASALNSWIRPLHDGSIAGLWGRILAIMIGLAPLLLFITGFLRWRHRRVARAHHASLRSFS